MVSSAAMASTRPSVGHGRSSVRNHRAATRAGLAPASTSPLSRPSASVVSPRDTPSRICTNRAPNRARSSVRISGITFSAGCRPRSSTQLHEISTSDRRIGGEQQRHVDVALIEGLPRDRSAGVELDELLELRAVDPSEPCEALASGRTFRWAAERKVWCGPCQVAEGTQALAIRSRPSNDECVRVLRRCRRERRDVGASKCARQTVVRRRHIRRRPRCSQTPEVQRRAGVLGYELDQTPRQCRGDELAADRGRTTAGP